MKKKNHQPVLDALKSFAMRMSMASQELMAKLNALEGHVEVRGNDGVLLEVRTKKKPRRRR